MGSPEPRPLGDLLGEAVEQHAERVALRMDDSTWTYRELLAMVERTAAMLAGHGVTVGSRVGLSAGNSPEFVATVFATARLGAVIIMISTAWREREVDHALELTQPTHLVVDGSGATDLARLVTDRPVLDIAALAGGSDADAAAPSADIDTHIDPHIDPHVDVDSLAVMVFSSGTTGLPKAVQHTHRTMFHGIGHWVDALGLTAADRLQIATPPFHILGLLNLYAVVAAGASARLHRRFDLDTVLDAIEHDGITIEMAVAPIALAIAAHPELERFDLSTLRYIMWGATPVTASVADTITSRTGVPVMAAYGASELPFIAANPVDRPEEWRLDSVGPTPADVAVRVVDLDTGHVLGADRPGELQLRSPSLMVGYLTDDDDVNGDSDPSIVDGWYATGDVGTVDAEGWITITDRVKEMIKVNGFQVAPAEIEGVLLGHAAVADCAVFGVPDERTGEAVVAAVVVRDDASTDAAALQILVARSLASYKRVAEVVFVDEIPRLPSGKVLRRELRAAHTT